MTKILVVDDSAVDRQLAAGLLRRIEGAEVLFAMNGSEAVAVIADQRPDLVLTDMQMPEMDGLALVRAIGVHHPDTPVILMTAHGSEALAVTALEQGAASYVPKSQLAERLTETVARVLQYARADRGYEDLIQSMRRTEFDFELENDVGVFAPLLELVRQIVVGMGVCEMSDRFRIASALEEALLNALVHGNLELDERQVARFRDALAAGGQPNPLDWLDENDPRRQRSIRVDARITREEARFVVADQGAGFDVAAAMARAESAIEGGAGRGLLLMRSCMDELRYNPRGNEVVLVKRRGGAGNPLVNTDFDV